MDNKDVIVVAGATHREGFIDEYETQLAQADIPFYLEQLEPLPGGANSITMRKRLVYWRKMAEMFIDYKVIIITDAWDVLFFGTRKELIEKSPVRLLCSAERNCYPEPHLTTMIHGDTPWKYANNGCIAAAPDYLVTWCHFAEEMGDLDILDQAWFNRRLAEEHRSVVTLDETTSLFYVVSATQEDGALQCKDGRPYNSTCDTHPSFLHFSGKCPSDGVRKMLEEQIEIIR